MLLNDYLSQLGFAEVHIASSSIMGDTVMDEEKFDIGFFDVNLRGCSGIKLAERFHAMGGRVVFVSGYDVAPEILTRLKAIHLPKPITPGALSRCLALLDARESGSAAKVA